MHIYFACPIRHDSNRLHLVPPPPHCRPPHRPNISIGALNIRNGRVFGIPQAVLAVELGGFKLMFLTDMKISTAAYFRNRLGHAIVCLPVRPASALGLQIVVGLVSQYWPMGWIIELTRFHSTNMVSCKVVTGISRTLIVGSYLPSSTLAHLPDLE